MLREVAAGLFASGGTSISAALESADMVLRRRTSRNPVTGVLLLSDGQSSDREASQSAARSIVAQGGVVHTFGFGSDHDAAMMNGIAVEGGGNFTFIERYDTIRESFAACIGSLTDIVAQNMKVRLTAAAGITFGRVYSAYPVTQNAENTSCELTVGDLCDGERRDILVTLNIPVLASPGAAPISVLDAALSYSRPNSTVLSHAATVITLDRPAAEALPADATVRDVEVDLHRNRVAATAAMAEALTNASSGRYDAVRRVLTEAQESIRGSVSAGEDVSEALLEDLQACASRLSSREADARGGRNYVMQAATSHSRQKAFYTPGSSNAAMWCGRNSMAVSDAVYSTRSAEEIHADCFESPASSAMPKAMQKMAARKKAGGDMCLPVRSATVTYSSPSMFHPPSYDPLGVLPSTADVPIAAVSELLPPKPVSSGPAPPPPHPGKRRAVATAPPPVTQTTATLQAKFAHAHP
jgi:von Willebrand factor type A domain